MDDAMAWQMARKGREKGRKGRRGGEFSFYIE